MKKGYINIDQNHEKIRKDFHVLVVDFSPQVFRLAWQYLKNEENAKDIVQEVFTEVWVNLEKFEHRSGIKTWIYRITVNKCLNFLKKHKRMIHQDDWSISGSDDEPHVSPADTFSNIKDSIDASWNLEVKERRAIVDKAMTKLPDNQRTAFLLMYFQELSYKEIAETMNLSISSIESLLHRAKVNLRKLLAAYYENKI